MNWNTYVAEFAPDGGHRKFPQWSISGEWEFTRSDGLRTPHKIETPYVFWRSALEEAMRLADAHIALGAPLLAGMRSREDPDYRPLFEMGQGKR